MNYRSVALVGCGGTGSYLAEPLARLLAYGTVPPRPRLLMVDGDRVEARNLERQGLPADGVGRAKVDALSPRVRDAARGLLDVVAVGAYVDGPGLASMLPRGPAMILATVDSHASRLATLEAADLLPDVDWVSPGHADASGADEGPEGTVATFQRRGGCAVGPDPREAHAELREPRDLRPDQVGCQAQAPAAPQLLLSNLWAATITLAIVQRLLVDAPVPREVHWDSIALRLSAEGGEL